MSNSNRCTKRRYASCVCLMLFVLLPTASSCTKATLPAEPATITFAYFGRAEEYEPLIQEFNEIYPHITVELNVSDEDEADVFIVSPFGLSDLLAEDAILSLDPFIEQDESFDRSDFYAGTIDLCSIQGRLWAIPAGAETMVLYYNQDLFDKYGVPYPEPGWTWDDFLTKALALRDPGADVFGYVPVEEFLDHLPFVYQHGGRIVDDTQTPTRTTFDDPLTIEAMEWYAALIHEHNVAPNQRQMFDIGGTAETGVYLNQVAMWIHWLSERGGGESAEETWPGEWKMRWGMVPLPRDAYAATLAFVAGYAISSQAAAPEACWQWVAFLSRQLEIPYDLMPARRSLAESTEYERLVGGDVAKVARESMEEAILLSSELVEFVPFSIYAPAIFDIINGDATAQEALTEAQQQAEQ